MCTQSYVTFKTKTKLKNETITKTTNQDENGQKDWGLFAGFRARRDIMRSRSLTQRFVLFLVVLSVALLLPVSAHADACSAPPNAIVAENCLTGNPASEWDISGAGDATIQGFATDISVNRGQTISFKVKTDASAYRIDIYRIGFYGGNGARKVATITPSATLPQNQPACLSDATPGMNDGGNLEVSASWDVPATAVPRRYIGRLVRSDTGGASHMVFIVRDDSGGTDELWQPPCDTRQ